MSKLYSEGKDLVISKCNDVLDLTGGFLVLINLAFMLQEVRIYH